MLRQLLDLKVTQQSRLLPFALSISSLTFSCFSCPVFVFFCCKLTSLGKSFWESFQNHMIKWKIKIHSGNQLKQDFWQNFEVNFSRLSVFFSGLFDLTVLIFWYGLKNILRLHEFRQILNKLSIYLLKLMTPQAVHGTWLNMGSSISSIG